MRLARVLVVTGLAVGAFVGGCDCSGEGPAPAGRASLIGRFPDGDTVQSDGQSRLKLSLSALDAARKPDTKSITVTLPAQNGGFIAAVGADFEPGNSLTATPNGDGALDLEYACTPQFDGDVRLSASNGDADATITIHCRAPQGNIDINIEGDDDCDELHADGQADCVVTVTAALTSNDVVIPFAGVIDIEVASVTVTDPDPSAVANEEVLAPASGSGASDHVTLAPDDTGTATFRLVAGPVAEIVTVKATAGTETATKEFPIAIFTNVGGVDATLVPSSVTGGVNTALLTITGKDPNGNPADSSRGDKVTRVAISEATPGATLQANGGTPAAELTNETDLAFDADGKLVLTVTTPTVTEQETATITIEFARSIGGPVTDTETLTVNKAGTLVVNLSADPTTVHSDDDTRASSTVTVTLAKDGNAVSGGTVSLNIPPEAAAALTFADGTTNTTIDTFDANGEATIEVVAVSQAPTTAAKVIGIGHDATSDSEANEVEIRVERAPILQNIVFISVTPAGSIGVLGSSLPSSALVKFQLIDDSNNPVPNKPVTFEKNTTADSGITVLPNAVSDNGGFVQTVLSAGTIPGPVTVIAKATADTTGATRVGNSTVITIVGGLPTFEKSFVQCSHGTEPGIVATSAPWEIDCTAALVDRTSNAVEGVGVQFSSESGNEVAVGETDEQGAASATVASDAIINPGADVFSWSYAAIIPTRLTDLTDNLTGNPFTVQEAQACFDDTIDTPCNLLDLCNDPGTQLFCPLPLQCLADGNAAEVTLENPPTAIAVAADSAGTGARGQIISYLDTHRACGFPVSCLSGNYGGVGLSVTNGDECPANPGCFDFSGVTACPQDGLRTIMATTRGAEPFADANGNHKLDFDDVNHNGRMDEGEALQFNDKFVDLPEPFLDLNDNCARDDLTAAERFFSQPIFAVANTDIFSDVDGSDSYGFVTRNGLTRTDKVWDPDTTIFLTTHMLEIGSATLITGEACSLTNGAGVLTPTHTCTTGDVVPCVETTAGGIASCPIPTIDGTPAEYTLDFVWTDENGNCPSEDMQDDATVAIESDRAQLAGDVDVTLDAAACGFGDATNPLLPECKAMPSLHTVAESVTIIQDCGEDLHGAKPGKLTFTLGGRTVLVPFTVVCP